MNDVRLVLVDQIDPHPSNPRRELGDLTELSASIRAHGIRQNLLLVPNPDAAGRWRAVIGHRRLAAARAAGVVEVPAVVDESLSDADQLELMLLENIQRSDLSPVEEAEGYQGLLDLGVKVTMIARQTGRAAATVKRRLKLLALPDGAREKVHAGQASLEDAAVLDEFEGSDHLDELVEALGTNDFAWRVKNVRAEVAAKAELAALADELREAGVTILDEDEDLPDGMVFQGYVNAGQQIPPTVQTLIDAGRELVVRIRHTWADLYEEGKGGVAADTVTEEARGAQARANREAALTAHQLRDEFVRGMWDRKNLPSADRHAICAAVAPLVVLNSPRTWGMWKWATDSQEKFEALVEEKAATVPEVLLIAALHHDVGTYEYSWPRLNERALGLYDLLDVLGYVMSDAELDAVDESRARLAGTDEDDAEYES